mmetsp:Transcript_10850/g.22034  ORF Transcript_10850/g.22034 Transcript_10850/m.22034 type:complete len:221 (-) Transcript_10850:70-732(-)
MTISLPASARFVVPSSTAATASASKLLLLDVMDTLVADPFFLGFHKDLFGFGSIKELLAAKDQQSFTAFERGELSEAEHFASYFTDRRPVDGSRIRQYLTSRYEWMPGMYQLCTELQSAGVPMAAMSNYPAPWAPLIEDAVGLSQLVPWAFVSGEVGIRKPSPEAYLAALKTVGRRTDEVVFVDDSQVNCEAARALGITAIRFEGAAALRPELQRTGVLR